MSTREEFERWAESQGFSIKEYDPINNSYLDDHADVAWWAWEAAIFVERKACVSVCREHAFMATSRDGAEWALSCADAIAAR